ncbi:MAG TPA: hypothetical protein PK752_19525, partial [Accumulibacter sp.]|uniref:hypothetical protein n=1 Tax=Accumulibacter sp. TaxID=2053492 RepID=UPI002BA0039F
DQGIAQGPEQFGAEALVLPPRIDHQAKGLCDPVHRAANVDHRAAGPDYRVTQIGNEPAQHVASHQILNALLIKELGKGVVLPHITAVGRIVCLPIERTDGARVARQRKAKGGRG